MRIRRPSLAEIILQIFVIFLVIGMVYDLANASGAACGGTIEDKSGWCSLWGKTQEPMAWNYQNQDVYIRSGLIAVGLLVVGGIAPFFAPNAVMGVILVVATPYAGSWALNQMGLYGP